MTFWTVLPTWQSSSRDPAFDQQTFFCSPTHHTHTRNAHHITRITSPVVKDHLDKKERRRRKKKKERIIGPCNTITLHCQYSIATAHYTMTMTLDTPQQQRFGPVMNFDYPPHGQSPAFSNPWSSSPSAPHTAAVAGSNLYVGPPQPSLAHSLVSKPLTARAPTSSAPPLPSYGSMPVTATSAGMFFFFHPVSS